VSIENLLDSCILKVKVILFMKHEVTTYNTKRMLATSLKKAMKHKPFSKITVSEIIADCGVNRKTFYSDTSGEVSLHIFNNVYIVIPIYGWARRRIQWGNHWFPLGRFKGEGVSKRERGNRNPLSLFVFLGSLALPNLTFIA